MKLNKLIIVSIILLAIVTFGAASAAEDVPAGDSAVGESDVVSVPASDVEIETGGDVDSPDSASVNDVALDDNNASGDSETKLGATEGEVLSANVHVVTPDNFFDYFTSKGKMTNLVQPGDTLDFQGEFIASSSIKYVMVISKPINMISSTKNAYIDMDTHAGSMTGESPGNSFEINSGGSGTNITDIYFHNSQIWFYGAHNINAYNMSVVVEDQQIGSGVGTVALRGGSSNLTFRNCYFYTKNNGGSSTFVLTNASYVTVDHSIIKVEGNVGNMVYCNTYNMELPDGMYMPQIIAALQQGTMTLNDHLTITNSQIIHPDAASGICIAVTCQISSGYNVFENNTVDYVGSSVSLGQHAVVRGNIINGSSLSVAADSIVEENQIYGSTMSVAGAGSTVTGNYIKNSGSYAITIPNKAANKDNIVTNNYLTAGSKNGDDAVQDAGNRNTVHDNQEYQDPVSNVVTQDNFFEFFDDAGFLKEEITFDELIFSGEFSGLTDYVIINRPIGIVGDNAILNEMGIVVSASNVYLNDLTLKTTSSLGDLVYIEGSNVNITGFDIDYATGEESGRAINVCEGQNVIIRDATINYESHVTSDEKEAGAINIEYSENVDVVDSNIVTSLPALYVTAYDSEDMFMGLNTVNPIRIDRSNKIRILNSVVTSINNDYSQPYATIQAFLIKNTDDCLIDGNNISVIDEFAQKDQDIYLYGITFSNDQNLVMSNNDFYVHTEGGVYAAGTAYAVQGITSTMTFVRNNITTFSNGPNIGIYVTSMSGESANTIAEFNIINVTGYGAPGNDWALVTGIEIQNGDAYLYNNTIYTYNVGEYADDNYMYGISYTQWMYGDRTFDIRDNTIITDGKYTVYTKQGTGLTVTGNILYGHDLVGDDSVNPNEGEGVLVENNYPAICNNITVTVDDVLENQPIVVVVNVPGATGTVTIKINNKEYVVDLIDGVASKEISDYGDDRFVNATFNGDFKYYPNWNTTTFKVRSANVVVNDTFFNFFDEDGILKSSILYEELIFEGDFSGLGVDVITLNRPIDIVGDEAVLYDIGLKIISNDVKVSDMAFIAEDVSFTSNNGAVIFISDVDVTLERLYIDYYAPSNANAYAIYAINAVDFNLLDSNVVFNANNVGVKVFQHGIEIRDCEYVLIEGNEIYGYLPCQDAEWGSNGINNDYPLLIGIQNGGNIDLVGNEITIENEAGAGSFPTVDGIMADSVRYLTISQNNITHTDRTGEGKAGYTYAVDLYNVTDALIEYNNITADTTTGVEGAGAAYPIQLTGPFTVDINHNNLTALGKGPVLGIYAAHYNPGLAVATITYNVINVTGYASAGNWALVSGIEFQGNLASIYNNTIYVQSINSYGDDNGVYGISYVQGNTPREFDIQNNTIFSESKYAIKLASANNSNVTENFLYGHELFGNDAAVAIGENNVVENNYPVFDSEIIIDVADVWIGFDNNIVVTVPNATGKVNIKINGETYSVDLNESVAEYILPASVLVAGENTVEVEFIPDGFTGVIATNTTTFRVLDGVITNETYPYYFGEDHNLVDCAPEGAVLDFQGLFVGDYVTNINKPVNIITSTGDALFTTGAGNKANFNILAGGDHTNLTGLNFFNTCVFVKGASYVTIDGISVVANESGVGKSTGFVSIHSNAYYTTVKNCYMENGGTGSSLLVLGKGGKYATFDNNTCNVTGSSGNILSSNIFVGTGDNPEFVNYTNNRIISSVGEASNMYGITVCGQGNIIENNTLINFKGNGIINQFGATSTKNIYRNNTITGGGSMQVGTFSLVEGNTLEATLTVTQGCTAVENNVYGLTISGKDAVVENNTVAGAVTISGANTTFVGNDVLGTVTVRSNNNILKENRIITDKVYAVDLTTKTGNEVTDNWLYALEAYGDEAVKFTGDNTVKDNLPYKPNLTVSVENITVGDVAVINVELNANATGILTVIVDGKLTDIPFADGKGTLEVEGLSASDYTVTATFVSDRLEFGDAEASTVFNVAKVKNDITISVPETINVGDSPVIDISVGNVNGTVSVIINGKEQTVELENGKGNVTIENINAGDYSIVANYAGDKDNEPVYDSASFSVDKIVNELIISVPENIKAGESPVANISLGNVDGSLTVIVDGKQQTVTLKDGKANVTLEDISAGDHSIVAIFAGDVNNEFASNSISFGVDKTATSIVLEIDDGLFVGDSTVIKAYINATGNVTFFVDGAGVSVPIEDGVATLDLTDLTAGEFEIYAIYFETELYLGSDAQGILKVSKWNSTISASAEAIEVGENATVVVTLPADATGKVVVDGKYSADIIDGVANVVVPGLTQNATLTVVYDGDDKYLDNSTSVDVVVSKVSEYNMTVNTSSADGKITIDVELPADATGNVTVTTPEGNQTVPVEDGKATAVISDVPAGETNVNITYSGDDKYNPQTTTQSVNATKKDSVLSGNQLVMFVQDGSKFTVTLTDSEGNPIADKVVKITIVGKTYNRKTDENGTASLDINLKAGSYAVSAVYPGDDEYNVSNVVETSVEVYTAVRIDQNKDLTKDYLDSSKPFKVRALDKYGKPIAGEIVKITVAGKTYNCKSNTDGYASLAINLKPGTYDVVSEYAGYKVTNKITVKQVLSASDASYKKASSYKYSATLKGSDGKGISGKTVKFTINGKTFSAITNANGIATATINLALNIGKYSIKSTYEGTSVTKSITIK